MTRVTSAFLLIWLAVATPAPNTRAASVVELSSASNPNILGMLDPARQALKKGDYPWYDADKDRVRPVGLKTERETSWFKSIGEWIDSIFQTIGDLFAAIANVLRLPAIGGWSRSRSSSWGSSCSWS